MGILLTDKAWEVYKGGSTALNQSSCMDLGEIRLVRSRARGSEGLFVRRSKIELIGGGRGSVPASSPEN
jgi:hypothetical protein